MRLDVKGRIRNVSLPASKPLLPLYEAIVNSIQAIEDVGEAKGDIEITVLRDSQNLLSDQDRGFGDIIGFEISDNGIGFTDDNFAAFETSDTTYKQDRGGKGVGRFLWLVAFNKVEIESHFQANGAMKVRRFAFVPEGEGVQNPSCAASDRTTRLTTVRLTGFGAKYQETCPKKTETIAAHIVEHCLEFFIRRKCPRIMLTDRQSGDTLELNHVFQAEMVTKSKADDFTVKANKFYIVHVRLYSSHARDHLVHYCAHDRVVKSEKLRGGFPTWAARSKTTNTGPSSTPPTSSPIFSTERSITTAPVSTLPPSRLARLAAKSLGRTSTRQLNNSAERSSLPPRSPLRRRSRIESIASLRPKRRCIGRL